MFPANTDPILMNFKKMLNLLDNVLQLGLRTSTTSSNLYNFVPELKTLVLWVLRSMFVYYTQDQFNLQFVS